MPTATLRPATRYATLGDPEPLTSDNGPDSPYPITTQSIRAGGQTIGAIYHRRYESGHPGRYEVALVGGRSWSFHGTEQDAHRAADEYAQAFLQRGPHRLPDCVIDLNRLASPLDRAALAATPSLLRPWPTGRTGHHQIAEELRAALLDPAADLRVVLTAVAGYLAQDA